MSSPSYRELWSQLTTVAVTGTNGKTTTTTMLDGIFAARGEPTVRVTTLGVWVGGVLRATERTMGAFAEGVVAGVKAGASKLALEATSTALSKGFASRWPARVGVFTNLTRDHLDEHGSPEAYLAAKAQLFMTLPPGGAAVLNLRDPVSALLAEVTPPHARVLGYSVGPVHEECAALPLTLAAAEVEVSREGLDVVLAEGALGARLGGRLRLGVVGRVHAQNALAAAVAAAEVGATVEEIASGLMAFEGVPGRFEIVGRSPMVVVDYAHSPDALERTLATARELTEGRVWCVFGCGGERDQGKRPQMGAAADRGADEVVLTNDNPRGESPEAIAEMIEEGVGGRSRWRRALDRGEAIALAVSKAAAEDVVVIAGKGHECHQLIGGEARPFSDAEEARGALARRTSFG